MGPDFIKDEKKRLQNDFLKDVEKLKELRKQKAYQ